MVREFRVPSRVSCAARFLHGGFKRVLFRCAEGPAVHLRAQEHWQAVGANRRLSHRQRGPAADRADSCVYFRGSLRDLPASRSKEDSVDMSEFPAAENLETAFDKSRSADWERLLTVRQEVLRALEPARAAKTISGGLEARVTLVATGGLVDLLRKYSAQLPALFIVSQVEVTEGHIEGAALATGLEGLQIRIERAKGEKCERCWNYSTHVGENSDYPTLCERCVAALAEIDRDSAWASGSVKA